MVTNLPSNEGILSVLKAQGFVATNIIDVIHHSPHFGILQKDTGLISAGNGITHERFSFLSSGFQSIRLYAPQHHFSFHFHQYITPPLKLPVLESIAHFLLRFVNFEISKLGDFFFLLECHLPTFQSGHPSSIISIRKSTCSNGKKTSSCTASNQIVIDKTNGEAYELWHDRLGRSSAIFARYWHIISYLICTTPVVSGDAPFWGRIKDAQGNFCNSNGNFNGFYSFIDVASVRWIAILDLKMSQILWKNCRVGAIFNTILS